MEKIKETVDFINSKTNNLNVEIAIILGSGLGCFCDDLNGISIKYKDIPNFGSSNVKGHKGELLFANIEGKSCVIMQGRFHFYEGNSMQVSTFPIRVFKHLGVKTLIITNAAGTTQKDFNVGDIMLMKDHINFMGDNPLIGPNDDNKGDRFPDMTNCYPEKLQKIAKSCAKKLNLDLKEGVYLATTGPSYETPAEVRMFKMLGADVIGMSSVPEAIVANYLKIKTVGFSTVTNYCTGISDKTLSHQEVIDAGKITGQKLTKLIKEVIKEI